MRRPQVLTVVLLALTATCREASAPATIVAVAPESARLSAEGLETLYGPERFTRGKGKPEIITRTISTVGFEAPFVLRLTSGDAAGTNRVSSGSVELDGVELLTPQSFNQTQHEWAIAVAPQETSTLTVSLASAPGSYLDIRLDGKRSATLFCPDGAGGSVTDLRQAIVQTPVDGTVLVCDGLHNVRNVIIDKPLTIRSQHPHGATLGDAEPGGTISVGNPILRINGVQSGLVRIVDLSFIVADMGIVTNGAFDKVDIDSASFVGVSTTQTVALRLQASTMPTARVDVINSAFENLQIGFWPVGALEANVRRSRFGHHVGGGVTFSNGGVGAQSFGVAEDNTFTNCGQNGCMRVLTNGAVVVARNRFEAPAQTVPIGAIFATTAFPLTSTQVFEDNVIVSGPTAAPANTPQGWLFQTAIQISSATGGGRYIIRRNTMIDAHTGILIGGDVDATDNRQTGGVYAFRPQANRSVTFTRNDVVGTMNSFIAFNPLGQYQCNWWGSTAGPTTPPANVPSNRYTPWATEPIAQTSVSCVVPPPPPPAIPPGSLTIVRVCAVAAGPIVTVPTASEAYAAVAMGGTILFCDGTHTVQDLRIAKALTIRNEGPGKPMLDALGLRSNFDIRDVVGGAVTVRGLRFRGTWLVTSQPNNGYGANINVEGSYGSITIEDSEFFPSGQPIAYDQPAPGQPAMSYNSGIWTWFPTGNGITVKNNSFTGGDIGVGGEGATMRVESNRFAGQSNASVHLGPGVSVVTDNDVTDCGIAWCIAAFRFNNITVSNNRIRVDMSRQTSRTILMDGQVALVTGNTITGTGGTRDVNDHTTWPIKRGIAIHATNRSAPASSGTVTGNVVSGAYTGLDFAVINNPGTLSAEAHDNIVSSTGTPFGSSGTQTLVTLVMTRNDFSNYLLAGRQGNTFASFDLRCNWWGQPSGPTAGSYPSAWQSALTPWAVTPIAGQPGVACP